jgi:CheY-like chemotaxis protein
MFNDYTYLYVEDDPLSREIMHVALTEIMKVENYTILENSADFMKRVKAMPTQPNIVLLDIHMEPHNGFEMLEMLRADEAYNTVIVIALTASVMNQEVQRLHESGFNGAIGKPLDVVIFPELIQRIIDGEEVWYIT